MFALVPPIAPNFTRLFGRKRALSGPAAELNSLLERIRNRLYPESLDVLASWWLKTVYYAGHNRVWWNELDHAIGKAVRSQPVDATAVAISEIQTWLRQEILRRHKLPEVQPLVMPPFRPDLTPGQVAPYVSRVLNEWLPGEVARVLTAEGEAEGGNDGGMPVVTVAKVLERLLLREHFSPASLELMYEAAWLSPTYGYPAHIEIFQDVVLALLGRTAAPAPPILPATPLAGGFADVMDRASLVHSEGGEELHVPLDAARALEIVKHDPVRTGSIVVTMDGRWWESVRLQSGPENVIAYRPGGRLRIDFSAEHARLTVPWPETGARWPGEVHLPDHFALFGREWRSGAWERGADRTWLHLEFTGVLAIAETAEPGEPRTGHLRPASVEMAWSTVEQALATGVADAIDQLQRGDLIPVAHALKRTVDCLLRPWPLPRGDMERCLMSLRYLHGGVASVYGPIPWRVLPAPARTALLKRHEALAELLGDTFEGAPAEARTSPPRAA